MLIKEIMSPAVRVPESTAVHDAVCLYINRLKTMLDATYNAIIEVDRQGIIVTANRAMEKVLDMKSKNFFVIFIVNHGIKGFAAFAMGSPVKGSDAGSPGFRNHFKESL